MKNLTCFFVATFFLSCNLSQGNSSEITAEKISKDIQVLDKSIGLDLAKKYLISKTPNPRLSGDKEDIFIENGEVPSSEDENKDYYSYDIPTKDILVGDLNNDHVSDIAVHVVQSFGGNATLSQYLFFINDGTGKFHLKLHAQNLHNVFFTEIRDCILSGENEKGKVNYQLVGKKIVEVG